ncbi:MAG: T9SS type A sorting domain-containing protein, partial [Runella zeae]
EDNVASEDGWAMIAPNPVIGESFELQIKGQSHQKMNWEIMNLQGQVVQQNKFETEAYLHKQLIEVKGLKAGLYVLQVMAENRKTTLKLIKAN